MNPSMAPTRIGLLVVGVVLIALAATSMADPSMSADSSPDAALLVCKGKYRGGLKPSPDELVEVLNQHTAWVEDGGSDNPKLATDPRRANLCGADLRYASLHGANLSGATLEGAELRGANLSGAIMYGTNLKGATLYGT